MATYGPGIDQSQHAKSVGYTITSIFRKTFSIIHHKVLNNSVVLVLHCTVS